MSHSLKQFLSSCCLLFAASCNLDFKPSPQVSLNVAEAKAKEVFICQYKIDSVRVFDPAHYSFGVTEAWVEKNWNLALNNSGNETYHINEESSRNLVISMDSSGQLTEENYLKEWIIWDDYMNPTGLCRNKLSVTLLNGGVPDTFTLPIYKMNHHDNFKDVTLVGRVWLHKK